MKIEAAEEGDGHVLTIIDKGKLDMQSKKYIYLFFAWRFYGKI